MNFNFLFQSLTKEISYSMENLAIDSLLRWKLTEQSFLTTLLNRFILEWLGEFVLWAWDWKLRLKHFSKYISRAVNLFFEVHCHSLPNLKQIKYETPYWKITFENLSSLLPGFDYDITMNKWKLCVVGSFDFLVFKDVRAPSKTKTIKLYFGILLEYNFQGIENCREQIHRKSTEYMKRTCCEYTKREYLAIFGREKAQTLF